MACSTASSKTRIFESSLAGFEMNSIMVVQFGHSSVMCPRIIGWDYQYVDCFLVIWNRSLSYQVLPCLHGDLRSMQPILRHLVGLSLRLPSFSLFLQVFRPYLWWIFWWNRSLRSFQGCPCAQGASSSAFGSTIVIEEASLCLQMGLGQLLWANPGIIPTFHSTCLHIYPTF